MGAANGDGDLSLLLAVEEESQGRALSIIDLGVSLSIFYFTR